MLPLAPHAGGHGGSSLLQSVAHVYSYLQGILLELPLAGFFVKKLLGRACDVNDLPSLDPQLYASLMALRDYAGNVADLALYFTIADEEDPSKEVLPAVVKHAAVMQPAAIQIARTQAAKLQQESP